jgi:hypothetical protein
VVTGLGPDTGGPLSQHTDIDKLSFTGNKYSVITVIVFVIFTVVVIVITVIIFITVTTATTVACTFYANST